jgi:hypothetical protein
MESLVSGNLKRRLFELWRDHQRLARGYPLFQPHTGSERDKALQAPWHCWRGSLAIHPVAPTKVFCSVAIVFHVANSADLCILADLLPQLGRPLQLGNLSLKCVAQLIVRPDR